MHTQNAHGTREGTFTTIMSGRGWRCAGQLARLLIALSAAWAFAACSDDATGDDDAALDGGIDDALVDNGPLDCGVRPVDGAICVQGRLHDFVTDEAIAPGTTLDIYSFFFGYDQLEMRDDPHRTQGHVASNGRYFVWVDQVHIGDRCLALEGDVEGYFSGTINCYGEETFDIVYYSSNPDRIQSYKVFLIPEDTMALWVDRYPGAIDIAVERPLFLGQCLDTGWSRLGTGSGMYFWGFEAPAFEVEAYPYTPDRISLVDGPDQYYGDIPPGGATIFWAPPEDTQDPDSVPGGVRLTCNNAGLGTFDVTRETMDAGVSSFLIFNVMPAP